MTESSANVTQVTDDSFEADVLNASTPVLVDFWAPWCGPCKSIAPVLEEIAAMRDDVRVVKVNVDENTEMAAKFGVRAIPTLLLFKEGGVAGTKVGVVDKPVLLSFIDESIS
ncbi:thioredoxin [Candidatus Persebacteraceae bacterium Df01]|jgi:thioredoxin 1|uniref:Thioredoxin n=1 Tax=Candidatus Doriopsillibacter californiensis TaxID=2970740 RepID=A0ABT7QMK5_9GAMM|nr:thioredoxin [Candidatus Persebacteraceae bacterium Df01]